MNVMTALLNIALIHIILVLVLVILVRKENSAFGHARSKGGVTALGRPQEGTGKRKKLSEVRDRNDRVTDFLLFMFFAKERGAWK